MGPGEAKGGDGWGCTAHHPFRPDTCEFMAQGTPVHGKPERYNVFFFLPKMILLGGQSQTHAHTHILRLTHHAVSVIYSSPAKHTCKHCPLPPHTPTNPHTYACDQKDKWMT